MKNIFCLICFLFGKLHVRQSDFRGPLSPSFSAPLVLPGLGKKTLIPALRALQAAHACAQTQTHIGAHHAKNLTPDVAIISHVPGMGGSKAFLLLMKN